MTAEGVGELRRVHALRWQDANAAESYRFRVPYPSETFDVLVSLIGDGPRAVLDVGCGTGNIARFLAPHVERVDAVDISEEMIAAGRALPGGDAPNIDWQRARAEEAILRPPYGLVVGGESMHWVDSATALPRFASALATGGKLAVARVIEPGNEPWDAAVKDVIIRHSTGYAPFDMIGEWQAAGLFRKRGEHETAPILFEQPIEDYIAAFHAMSSLTAAHIDAATFDREIREIMQRHCPDGVVRRPVRGHLTWSDM